MAFKECCFKQSLVWGRVTEDPREVENCGWCATVFTWLFYDQDALAQPVGHLLSINKCVVSNHWLGPKGSPTQRKTV